MNQEKMKPFQELNLLDRFLFDNMLDFIDILKRNPACEEGTCVENYFRKHPCNAPIEWVR